MHPRRSTSNSPSFPPSTIPRGAAEIQVYNPSWLDRAQPNESRLLIEYLRLLNRGKWILLGFAALGVLVALGYTASRTQLYQARSSIEIQGINGEYANLKAYDPTTAFQD